MGVSIEQYRQRIGCFARAAAILSSLEVRRYKRNIFPKHSKDFGTALGIRLGCLAVLVAAVISSSLFLLDLTQFGDVEKNPGPVTYELHRIHDYDFEDFGVAAVAFKYGVPLLSFKKGRDLGVDAMAWNVNIDVGGKNILKNQNVVVQVKHTNTESAIFNDSVRNSIFTNEVKNVAKLMREMKLDIYIIVTNYAFTKGQSDKLEKMFEVKLKGKMVKPKVICIGYDTLCSWLLLSSTLRNVLRRMYPSDRLEDLVDEEAAQSMRQLDQFREKSAKEIVYVQAFTKVQKKFDKKNLVFITGPRGCGKTTFANTLVETFVKKSNDYYYYKNIPLSKFQGCWNPPHKKCIFFTDNMKFEEMKEWNKFKENVGYAIDDGSKFVFVGNLVEFNKASKKKGFDTIYERVCEGEINLSHQEYSLSEKEKQQMLNKRINNGNNGESTKKALLKMVSDAAEIDSPCFPLVAKSLGTRRRLEKFKMSVLKKRQRNVYNNMFLGKFSKWVLSCNEDESDESCESPPLKRLKR